jgi:hypothetical protein
MFRDQLVTLGDLLDFLEWRRVNRGIPYLSLAPPSTVLHRPAVRFYSWWGRTYTVSNKGQLYRLKGGAFRGVQASEVSCCSFGDNKKTWITLGLGFVRIQTTKLDMVVRLKEGVLSSFSESGHIAETVASCDGNRVLLGVRRK